MDGKFQRSSAGAYMDIMNKLPFFTISVINALKGWVYTYKYAKSLVKISILVTFCFMYICMYLHIHVHNTVAISVKLQLVAVDTVMPRISNCSMR